jgi:hypothetical protein
MQFQKKIIQVFTFILFVSNARAEECCSCAPTHSPTKAPTEQVTLPPSCVGEPLDIFLMLDDSRSIKNVEKFMSVNFVVNLLNILDLGVDKQRVAFAQFSKTVYDVIDFNNTVSFDKPAILEHVTDNKKRTKRNGATHTNEALKEIKKVYDATSRDGVDKVVIFVTDGVPFDQPSCGKPRKGQHQIECAREEFKELMDDYPDMRFVYLAVGRAEDNEELKGLFTFDSYSPT